MAFYDGLLNAVRNIGNKAKGLASSLKFLRIGTMEVYTEINTQKAIDKGFNSNTAVYSIVMRDAEKFAAIPRYVYDAKEMEEKAADVKLKGVKAQLEKLLNRPNEYQSQDSFLMNLRAYFKVTGEAFIWLNRGDTGGMEDEAVEKMPVLEMYVLPSQYITIVPDPENLWGVKEYILEIGERVRIRKSDVIHWKNPGLKFDAVTRPHSRGFSALTAGYKTLEQHNSATDASVRMYQNDGAKGALYNETLDKLKPEQKSQIRSVVDAKINNNDVKGAVATLPGKWGFLDFGGTSVDLQLLEGKELSWKELCFLLETPYELFDSKTTYANKQEAKKGWILDTIIPASKQLDGELNRVLLKAFGLEGIAFIGCDHSELPELQQDLQKMVTALKEAWWLSPNQKLKMMNEEANKDPLFDEPWIPNGISPLSQLGDDGGEAIIAELNKRRLNDYGNAGGDRA